VSGFWEPLITGLVGGVGAAVGMLTRKLATSRRRRIASESDRQAGSVGFKADGAEEEGGVIGSSATTARGVDEAPNPPARNTRTPDSTS